MAALSPDFQKLILDAISAAVSMQNQQIMAQLQVQSVGLVKCFEAIRTGSEAISGPEKERDAEFERLAKRLKDSGATDMTTE